MQQFLLKHTFNALSPISIYNDEGILCYKFNYIQRIEKKIFPLGDLELIDSNGNKILTLKQEKILGYPFNYIIEKNNENVGKVYSIKSSRLNPEFILLFNGEEYKLKVRRKAIFSLPKKFNVIKGNYAISDIYRLTLSFRFKIDVKAEDELMPIFLLAALLYFYCHMGTGLMGSG